VTMGAYLNAINVLGLEVRIVSPSTSVPLSPVTVENKNWIPVHIDLEEFPQLKQLV